MSDFRIKYIIDCGSIYKRIKNAVFDFCGVQGYKESLFETYLDMETWAETSNFLFTKRTAIKS